MGGANQTTPPYLDAVADLDSFGNFYWTSTRNYPLELDNLFHGSFNVGNVNNIGRVRGDFNKNIPGWLIMDHGISIDGQLLYYNNARFDGICPGPCETEIGIAQKVNDSTFNKISNSDNILQNINDTNYIYYAPCISSDNLELYYTRYLKGAIVPSTLFEICVAVRDTPTDIFSVPKVLFSELISDMIEAPTLTTDKQIIYYHKKIAGSYKIVMRYRDNPLGIEDLNKDKLLFTIYPNPSSDKIIIKYQGISNEYDLTIVDILGREVIIKQRISDKKHEINIVDLTSGVYLIQIHKESKLVKTIKFIKD